MCVSFGDEERTRTRLWPLLSPAEHHAHGPERNNTLVCKMYEGNTDVFIFFIFIFLIICKGLSLLIMKLIIRFSLTERSALN